MNFVFLKRRGKKLLVLLMEGRFISIMVDYFPIFDVLVDAQHLLFVIEGEQMTKRNPW